MTQLSFFKTFGPVIAAVISDHHTAMKAVSKAWLLHKQQGRQTGTRSSTYLNHRVMT